jgi:hypothetical protein
LFVIQFRENRLIIVIISQTFVTKALLFLSFARPVKQRVKKKSIKKVNIRFFFLRVYVSEFSII